MSTWLVIGALVLGAAIVGLLFFFAFSLAWAAWGFIGTLVILGAIGIGLAYLSDRRKRAGHSAA